MRERERGLRNLAIFLSFAHSHKVICKKSDVDGHVNSFFQISFCSNDDDEADDDGSGGGGNHEYENDGFVNKRLVACSDYYGAMM